MIVADASLVIAWLLDEPEHSSGNVAFDLLAQEAVIVPANWPAEVANALRRACRTGRIQAQEIEALLHHMTVFDIVIAEPIRLPEIGALAVLSVDCGVSSYDAAYLRLALDRGIALATVDGPLRKAAAALGVHVIPS